MNRIEQAIAESSETEVREFLSPFGVATLPELAKKFGQLEAFKKSRTAVEESEKAKAAEEAVRGEAFEVLKAANIGVTESSDIRVTSYLKLNESERTQFVKSQMLNPMGANRTAKPAEPAKKEGELEESEKSELLSAIGISK